MHFPALVFTAQRRMGDMVRKSFSIPDFAQGFDEAAKWVQGETGILQNRTSLSVVANQRAYTPATSVQKPGVLEYWDSAGPHEIDARSREQYRAEQTQQATASIPRIYTFLETERALLLDPKPSTSAGTTTLTGAHSASVTTLTVADTTGFPSEGRLIIESEVVSYNSTTSTTFAGVTRGIEGTTAASHTGSTVTERDLLIWGDRQYQDLEMRTFYSTGTVAITNGLTALVGTNTVWATNVKAGDWFGTSADVSSIMPTINYQITTVTDSTNIVLASNFDQPTVTTANYVIGSPNPFPSYCDGILVSYAVAQLLKKTGNFQLANLEYASARNTLESVKLNQLQSDVLIRPRAIRESVRRGRPMGVWSGDTWVN